MRSLRSLRCSREKWLKDYAESGQDANPKQSFRLANQTLEETNSVPVTRTSSLWHSYNIPPFVLFGTASIYSRYLFCRLWRHIDIINIVMSGLWRRHSLALSSYNIPRALCTLRNWQLVNHLHDREGPSSNVASCGG